MIYSFFQQHVFAWPWAFALLLLAPLIIWQSIKKRHQSSGMRVSAVFPLATRGWKARWYWVLTALRVLAMMALVTALARPQLPYVDEKITGNGIDILLCLDVSGSMLAQDLEPNRLEAAKTVAAQFVDQRKADRMGLVIFSGESFTLCPITADHAHLKEQIASIESGQLEDGTAIGSGLATSIDRLQQQEKKSKVVILLTDGENNGGDISPLDALSMAKSLGVKVYTIGVGTTGYANVPVKSTSGQVMMQKEKVNIDEGLLQSFAEQTGGQYFRAKDTEGLQRIYTLIDQLEKSRVTLTQTTRFAERYQKPLLIGLLLLLLEIGLSTLWRRMV